jgi:hypothetical protein
MRMSYVCPFGWWSWWWSQRGVCSLSHSRARRRQREAPPVARRPSPLRSPRRRSSPSSPSSSRPRRRRPWPLDRRPRGDDPPRRHPLPGAAPLRVPQPPHLLRHVPARQVLDADCARALGAGGRQRAVSRTQQRKRSAHELGPHVDALAPRVGDEGGEVVVEELPVWFWLVLVVEGERLSSLAFLAVGRRRR